MAFSLSWACVIFGCIFASLAGTSSISEAYPPLWKESPGQFSDYNVENGKYIINVWHYPERLGTYKILLNKTAKYFEKYAPENEQNILWGLAVQHGWQYHTGRLADPTQMTDCGHESGDHLCISVDSWSADINYYLSAMPFFAAVDSGIMGISSDNVTVLPPSKDQMSFCYNVSSCHSSFPEVMKKWNEFYQHVKSNSSNCDDLLKYLWAAHVSSLEVARKNFHNRLKYYSKQEADFERNWALFVDYLAPSLFPTTLIRTHEFQKGLPTRVLVSGDRAPFIKDFTGFQNTILLALNFIQKMHEYTGTLSFAVWKTLMKLKIARKLFVEILEFILHFFN
ncbi:PREDICTED: protein LEG1 homolog [Ceratotherium simum simum]|uniref:Protein LEG1 homolog n=1 Tax=Ceratotherium simum simum TaxID=73337 RepID=A0ABM1CAW4_CERSS|nr:PREDICTED: protein LEG1 homolog [Ceratotherium simum simum]